MKLHLAILRNWWVIVFILMAGAIYIEAIHKKNRLATLLLQRVETLSAQKKDALEKREELLLRVKSQDDPDSIELILKEKLGVRATKEVKVVFQ